MKLIVGLGNPGREYKNTRHNIGFDFLDYYINSKGISVEWSNKFDGKYIQTIINGEKVFFLKPQTFMNLSGNSVRKIVDYFKIDIADILIVSDDMDLNVGNFKLKDKGSSGGHNGLKDIEKHLGTTIYKRLKIGISKDNNKDVIDYVLGSFSLDDRKKILELFDILCLVIDDYLSLPFSDLMNKYNRKNR